jgi:small subunit ribosomal protein S17
MTEQTTERNARKVRTGIVTSDKMEKTVVVKVTRRFPHPLYGKQMTRSTQLKAHDDMGAVIGDTVKITETRPTSKTKRWRVIEIIERAE